MRLEVELYVTSEPVPVLAQFLGARRIEEELGAPLRHVAGKTWVLALARGSGALVGLGGVFLAGGAAELGSGWVEPYARGLGVYRALVEGRLALARVAHHTAARAKCGAQAAAALQHMGWRDMGLGDDEGRRLMGIEW